MWRSGEVPDAWAKTFPLGRRTVARSTRLAAVMERNLDVDGTITGIPPCF
jgi:hypothetical protein